MEERAALLAPAGALAVLLLLLPVACGTGPDRLFAEAARAERAGDYAEAVRKLGEIVFADSQGPHVPRALFELAQLHLLRTRDLTGAQVALEVTDEGRVALNEKIGPGVVRLEGTLAGVEGDEILVDADAAKQLQGYVSELGGVRVRLPQRYVTRIDQRQFSRKRTLLVVGGVVAVVAAFFATKISGKSTPSGEDPGGGPDQ